MSPVRPLMRQSFASEASLRKILGGSESWKLDVNPYSISVKRILAIMLLRHRSQRKKSEIPHVIADSGKSLYLTRGFPLSLEFVCFPYKCQPIPELKQAPSI